jgi:hypothetical protein
MAEYTLTYSAGVEGWPSFYSFIPEWIQGSNNYLYTFNKGDIWRHNVNDNRSNFYGEQFSSSVQTCLNQSSLETKVFKTINLIGTPGAGWGVTMISNLEFTARTSNFTQTLQSYDELNSTNKEGHMFSYLYNPAQSQADTSQTLMQILLNNGMVNQRSIQGVGQFDSANVESLGGNDYRINFPLGFQIPSILNVGDLMMCSNLSLGNPPSLGVSWWIGQATAIGINTDSTTPSPFIGQPMIEVDISPGVFPPSFGGGDKFLNFVKDPQAESYGLIGDYAHVTLSVTTSSAIELFSVGSEVMKSNP